MKVFSLWIGELTELEIFCINSFIKLGIEFELYSYKPLENVPEGVIECDANKIVLEEDIFTALDGKKETMATFSDYFRYSKLFKEGGIWVDMDIIVNKNFLQIENFNYFISGEQKNKTTKINNCVIKADKSDVWIKDLYYLAVDSIKNKPVKHLTLHKLFRNIVKKYNLNISDYWILQSVDYFQIPKLKKEKLIDIVSEELLKKSYGLHLYNSKWKRRPVLKGENLTNKLNEIYSSIN